MFKLVTKTRNLHSKLIRRWSSSQNIRRTFLDFFLKDKDHNFVKSSPVVPFCDPTVPFVNAGMNQFKGILMGKHKAQYTKVVNSQKCIRVGGKHNDLDIVGADGHHHTFFEMLGNWSFGDYYKKEACTMAWELLIGPYRLNPKYLHVTYFGGANKLNLDEDFECRDIWRSIGVPEKSLQPLGSVDNFWEMGPTGPCGPCTEIHFRHDDGSLTEIWNLVFIQYNRQLDGSISSLPERHIDTGMGLERMTSLIQNKKSNYDTDLFTPIIDAIHKKSGQVTSYSGNFGPDSSLDCAYRCLADHARMISVCLADGMFPGSNVSLKQIMRKSFKISEDFFKCDSGMLTELYHHVTETLGDTYPELGIKMKDAVNIIQHEERSYVDFRKYLSKNWRKLAEQYPEIEKFECKELPGFVDGYKQFKEEMLNKGNFIPGSLLFELYRTYGFDKDTIQQVGVVNNMEMDLAGFQTCLSDYKFDGITAAVDKLIPRRGIPINVDDWLLKNGVKATNDAEKYNYEVSKHKELIIPELNSKLISIVNSKGECLKSLSIQDTDELYNLVFEKTNFYCEEGGQCSDSGKILIAANLLFDVKSVFKMKDIIFHEGKFKFINEENRKYTLTIGDMLTLSIDNVRRQNIMRNHTATHLLNTVIKKMLPNSVSCQIGSVVKNDELVFDLALYGEKLSQDVLLETQDYIRKLCEKDIEVRTKVINNQELLATSDVITLPGEVYPEEGLRLVQIEDETFRSRELCCGTHVPSTCHIKDFCITGVRGATGNKPIIWAVTGERATELRNITRRLKKMSENPESKDDDKFQLEVSELKSNLYKMFEGRGAAYGERGLCMDAIAELEKPIKIQKIAQSEIEMSKVLQQARMEGRCAVVHVLQTDIKKSGDFTLALKLCADMPVLLFGQSNRQINVVCQLPEAYVSQHFTASKWLSCILPILNAKQTPSTISQRPDLFAVMIPKQFSRRTGEKLVQEAVEEANSYAKQHNKVHKHKRESSR